MTLDEKIAEAARNIKPGATIRFNKLLRDDILLPQRLARAMWEEINIPEGRNWDDHAVSKARAYWEARARCAITFIKEHPL